MPDGFRLHTVIPKVSCPTNEWLASIPSANHSKDTLRIAINEVDRFDRRTAFRRELSNNYCE